MEKLYTVSETAKRLVLSESTIRSWIFNNKIDYVKINGAVRITQTTIDNLIKGE